MIKSIYNMRVKLYKYKWIKADKWDRYFNKFIKVYYRCFIKTSSGIYKNNTRKEKVIVSLTSIPSRFDNLDIVVESLMRQKCKPDKIILWLSNEDIKKLPQKVNKLQNRGLIIRKCDNILSHKKYYYVMQEYPNDIIITVDDDIIYSENMIEKLLIAHYKYPKAIICHRSHLIKKGKNGKIYPYNMWKSYDRREIGTEKIADDNFFTSGAGTLMKKEFFSEHVFDLENICKLAPKADDVWLNFMAKAKGTKIINCEGINGFCLPLIGNNRERLTEYNVKRNGNDIQIKNILEEYKKLGGL